MLKISFYLASVVLVFLLILKLSDNIVDGDHVILQSWAEKKIRDEIAAFERRKFEQSHIANVYNDLSTIPGNNVIRFQIVNGKIYTTSIDPSNTTMAEANEVFYKFFTHMIKKYPIEENVDFLLSVTGDLSIPNHYDMAVPVIMPSKNVQSQYALSMFLAPDYKIIESWPRLYSSIIAANREYPWERKIAKAFWRGTASANGLTRENWQDLPKVKLVELSSQHADLLDAKFTSIIHNDKEIEKIMAAKYQVALTASEADFVKYKIEVNLDSNSSNHSAFLMKMLSNSLVLKQKSDYIQWFYDILDVGKYYIPVAYDFSDLMDKINWVNDNDAEAKSMATSASELIAREITPTHLYLYWSALLNKYAKIQKFPITAPTLAPANFKR